MIELRTTLQSSLALHEYVDLQRGVVVEYT